MSEAEEEQTSCATADPDTETNSLSMTKGLLIDEAELSGKYIYYLSEKKLALQYYYSYLALATSFINFLTY